MRLGDRTAHLRAPCVPHKAVNRGQSRSRQGAAECVQTCVAAGQRPVRRDRWEASQARSIPRRTVAASEGRHPVGRTDAAATVGA